MGSTETEQKTTANAPKGFPKISLKHQILNWAGPLVPSAFPKVSSDRILKYAQKESNLSDWGEPSFIQALDVLCDSFKREARIIYTRRFAFLGDCVQRLITRMKVCRDIKDNPSILDKQIRKPLFVTGLPRTGTTFLHAMLARDPNARPLMHWEHWQPSPPPDPDNYENDPRIAPLVDAMNNFYEANPIFAKMHFVPGDGPDECNGLFLTSFSNNLYFYFYNIPSYVEWYLNADMTDAYSFYKKELQLLSWKFKDRHWVLKAPSHLYFLDVLTKVFPDACVVQTHRDPCSVLPSACSLAYHTRKLSATMVRPRFIGKQWAAHLARAARKGIDARTITDPKRFLDIKYKDLVADPIATVKRIYAYFDYAWSDVFEENLKKYIAENKQHKHGKHRYTLEQFGLDPKKIHRQFNDYCEAYEPFLELGPIT